MIKVIRQRLSAHEHPEAVADALAGRAAIAAVRAARRAGAIEAPVIVVASGDEADPEHPFAVGGALRGGDPGCRSWSPRTPGSSPIAWQGSRLSHVIADVAERARS